MTLLRVTTLVLIVGLLVLLAVPWFGGSRERGYVSVMRGDLRRLGLAQASYHYDHRVYTDDLPALAGHGFVASDGVMLTVNEATASGWAATAQHVGTQVHCYVVAGTAAPVGTATEDRNLRCD
jgi:hypothetical protein